MEIRELSNTDEVVALEPLLLEYFRVVCGDLDRLFDIVIPPTDPVASMMDNLDRFVPPAGRAFVAEDSGALVGMIFLKALGDNTLEVKRLYVRPETRGAGLGKRLVRHAIATARDLGAKRLYLDSIQSLKSAIALYESEGFEKTEPYPGSEIVGNAEIFPHAVFMVKKLDDLA